MKGSGRAAVDGGAGTVQVRHKAAGGRELFELVSRVVEALADAPEVILLVNDRVDVAAASRLAGLPVAGAHVGQSDLPPSAARAVLGPAAVLGLSVGTIDEVVVASSLPPTTVDYLGISPVYATATKPDAEQPVGREGAAGFAAATRLPCVGIGGLKASDAAWMRPSGLAGAAVVSAVSLATDPRAATRRLVEAWERAEEPAGERAAAP